MDWSLNSEMVTLAILAFLLFCCYFPLDVKTDLIRPELRIWTSVLLTVCLIGQVIFIKISLIEYSMLKTKVAIIVIIFLIFVMIGTVRKIARLIKDVFKKDKINYVGPSLDQIRKK